jgi:hypothetical protein
VKWIGDRGIESVQIVEAIASAARFPLGVGNWLPLALKNCAPRPVDNALRYR